MTLTPPLINIVASMVSSSTFEKSIRFIAFLLAALRIQPTTDLRWINVLIIPACQLSFCFTTFMQAWSFCPVQGSTQRGPKTQTARP